MSVEPWDGVTERRHYSGNPDVKEEFARLRAAFEQLATALDLTKLDQQSAQIRRHLIVTALSMTILFLGLVWFSLGQVHKLEDRLKHGQEDIICILLIPPEQRSATAVLSCTNGEASPG